MSGELILLVDDEPNILQLAKIYLEQENYRVTTVRDGRSAMQAVDTLQPALMILDLMLPEINGLEVCRRLREKGDPIPILMLTARDEDLDKILGLELGADDYLTKPFNPRELVARVRAILRRQVRIAGIGDKPSRVGDVVLDPARREVTLRGEAIDLRPKEFDLLKAFIDHKGLVLSREQLLHQVWGYDYLGETRTVDVHVGSLRKKLAESSACIETVIGIGYKLVG